jgi:hypothetical protein
VLLNTIASQNVSYSLLNNKSAVGLPLIECAPLTRTLQPYNPLSSSLRLEIQRDTKTEIEADRDKVALVRHDLTAETLGRSYRLADQTGGRGRMSCLHTIAGSASNSACAS